MCVFSKGRMDRARKGDSTVARDEFLRNTLSIWDIPAESARRIGHPAPFPVELPHRLIELHTYCGDVVLDPFLGSGSTAIAAVQAERVFVEYELTGRFARLARRRVREAVEA
jgi:site-specific DNA-methyltransferase (adenine-specific)